MKKKENYLLVNSAVEWRKWLKRNGAKETEVWLVFYKKESGKQSIGYGEALDEALCFGWIDSLIKRIDDEKYVRKFTPRKDKSKCSEANKKRVEELIKEKRMTKRGLAKITAAKENGQWNKLDRPSVSPEPPEEFSFQLKKNPKAKKVFDKLAPSHKKQYLLWINSAKKAETKNRRIQEAVKMLEKNEKLGMK